MTRSESGVPPEMRDIDLDRFDDVALAVLYMTLHHGNRVWKGLDFNALHRLHRRELIADPVGKTKSVVLTDDGISRADRLFTELFGK